MHSLTRETWWQRWRGLVIPPVIAVVGAAIFFGILAMPIHSPYMDHLARICNQQVAVLFNTHDLVELRRAQFLIRWFNCDIERRAP